MSALSRAETMELLETGKYSDFTIRCGSVSFSVHKNIIAPRSEFFHKAVNSGFKESIEDEITLKETAPFTVAMVIVYLYLCDDAMTCEAAYIETAAYSVYDQYFLQAAGTGESNETPVRLEHFTDLYLLADRLMLDELREIADKGVGQILADAWDKWGNSTKADDNFETLEQHIEQAYEKLPIEDTKLRPNLTVWILTQRSVARIICSEVGEPFDEGEERLIDLVDRHDENGSLFTKLAVRRAHDGGFHTLSTINHEALRRAQHRWR